MNGGTRFLEYWGRRPPPGLIGIPAEFDEFFPCEDTQTQARCGEAVTRSLEGGGCQSLPLFGAREPLRAIVRKNGKLNTKAHPAPDRDPGAVPEKRLPLASFAAANVTSVSSGGGGVKSLSPLDATTAQGSFTDFFSDTGSFD